MNVPLVNVPRRERTPRLKLGDLVFLDGEIVATAGLPTHQRIIEYIAAGEAPPVDLAGRRCSTWGTSAARGRAASTPST